MAFYKNVTMMKECRHYSAYLWHCKNVTPVASYLSSHSFSGTLVTASVQHLVGTTLLFSGGDDTSIRDMSACYRLGLRHELLEQVLFKDVLGPSNSFVELSAQAGAPLAYSNSRYSFFGEPNCFWCVELAVRPKLCVTWSSQYVSSTSI
ncbi:uncharacterized protein LOC127084956 [Lathyrus oleraceus]|uniref:uncharacterized protein LOC127084956 n=1 Tax=Pisum sativum TaxID=3888 RepID=UPI0021D3B4E7|nr:uncharacterized protein LOC127084956 [Pisum sativum]